MVSLQEIIDLKDKLVGLMFTCLEITCSELPPSRVSSLFKSQKREPTPEDVALLFAKETRQEMMIIINKIFNLLASVKHSTHGNTVQQLAHPPPPPPLPVTVPEPPSQDQDGKLKVVRLLLDSKVDISAIPLSQLKKIAASKSKIMKKTQKQIDKEEAESVLKQSRIEREGREKVKLAIGYYMGTDPKPSLYVVAEKFDIKLPWLVSSLMEKGYEVNPYYSCAHPNTYLRHRQNRLDPVSPLFKELKPEEQARLSAIASEWIHSGPNRLHVPKQKFGRGKAKKIEHVLDQINEEQRRDILDFYETHYKSVSFRWILHQAAEKYQTSERVVGKLVVLGLMGISEKDIKPERRKSEHHTFEQKKNQVLNFARTQREEDRNVSQMIRQFDLKVSRKKLSKFLMENGIEVMTSQEKRIKKLADQGLPYTYQTDPERRKKYVANYQAKLKARQAAGESGPASRSPITNRKRDTVKREETKTAATRKGTKKSPTKKASDAAQQRHDWNVDFETDEAIAQLNNQTLGTAGHQYATRSTPRQSAVNLTQYDQYH